MLALIFFQSKMPHYRFCEYNCLFKSSNIHKLKRHEKFCRAPEHHKLVVSDLVKYFDVVFENFDNLQTIIKDLFGMKDVKGEVKLYRKVGDTFEVIKEKSDLYTQNIDTIYINNVDTSAKVLKEKQLKNEKRTANILAALESVEVGDDQVPRLYELLKEALRKCERPKVWTRTKKHDAPYFENIDKTIEEKKLIFIERLYAKICGYIKDFKERTMKKAAEIHPKKRKLTSKEFELLEKDLDRLDTILEENHYIVDAPMDPSHPDTYFENAGGDIKCQGAYGTNNYCKYEHSFNPFLDINKREEFSKLYEMDHTIERSTIISEFVEYFRNRGGRKMNMVYIFELLATKENIRLVHGGLCHLKARRPEENLDSELVYESRKRKR